MLSIEPNERVAFKVRHEDPDLVIVEKPAGLVTQPGKGHERDSLLNGLFARYGSRLQQIGRERDFGLLHRLDKPTSGLLAVALTRAGYDAMRALFEGRELRKFYWAVVARAPKKPAGVINRPIVESGGDEGPRARPGTPKTARVSSGGKPSITAYRVAAANDHGAIIECRAVTGRLHQVRVHLESIGCPILGDDLYGPRWVGAAASRLALHAHRIAFRHPLSGAAVDVRSPLPRDLKSLLKRLGLSVPDRGHEFRGDPVGEQESGVGEPPTAV